MEEAREKGGVETGGGSDERWRRHERREVWRRELEVTRDGGGTRHGRCGDVGGSDERWRGTIEGRWELQEVERHERREMEMTRGGEA